MRHPVDLYAEAIMAHKAGDKGGAALKLSQALGSPKTTTPIATSIDAMLEEGTVAHDIVVGLLR